MGSLKTLRVALFSFMLFKFVTVLLRVHCLFLFSSILNRAPD